MSPGPVVLVAHGSKDPRAGATTRRLARVVASLRAGTDVRVAFLDHAGPRPDEVLFELAAAGHRRAVVVPLLLTSAYHDRVDLPAVLAGARERGLSIEVTTSRVPGGEPAPLLLSALRGRLAVAGRAVAGTAVAGTAVAGTAVAGTYAALEYDGVVLAAAGTRDALARSTVDDVAAALGGSLGVPAIAAYASAAPPAVGTAVAALRARGCRRVAVAAYFLAHGRLYDGAAESARSAGAVAVAEPLGSAVDLARLILARVAEAVPGPATVDLCR